MRMRNCFGFMLIEMLVAAAVLCIVLLAVYQAFLSQERASIRQQALVELQQNLRAALYIMTNEIRMAGYDRSGLGLANAGILEARPGLIEFTKDDNTDSGNPNGIGDGDTDDPNEHIFYAFSDKKDSNFDGIPNKGAATFGRQTCRPTGCSGFLPLAENIQAIRFEYAFDNDGDGQVDTLNGNIIWATDSDNPPDGLLNVGTEGIPLHKIRAVRISILGRTKIPLRDITDTTIYPLGNITVGPFNDTYRRRLLTIVVECRNMGLQ